MSKPQNIMVTGGAGYIGSILVRRLLQSGHKVFCVDKLDFGGASLIDVWDDDDFTLSKTDLRDHAAVDALFEGQDFDAVVHLAAIVGDPACRIDPELTHQTNWEAPVHLARAAAKAGVGRFVFASTCSNYGKMADPGGFVDEDSPLAPVSLYAELKVKYEQFLLRDMERVPGFVPTALRFATVYGMSPRMRFDLTVNEFSKELALDRELVVFGEQFWRPYCHVRDFSRAIMAVLDAPADQVDHDVFNVGSTAENYTKGMLIEELQRQLPEAKIKLVHKEEDPRDYRVRFEKIADRLGFEISRTVPEGMRDIVSCVRSGVVEDPDHQRHYNIPVA